MALQKLKIERKDSKTLIITKSKLAAIAKLSFLTLFYLLWYGSLFVGENKGEGFSHSLLINWLFWLVPLFSIAEIFRALKVITTGEVFFFDGYRKIIRRNDKRIAGFDDIIRIQVRTFPNSDDPDEHNLSLVFKNEDKIRIEQSQNLTEILNAAEEISELLNVEIKRKQSAWKFG